MIASLVLDPAKTTEFLIAIGVGLTACVGHICWLWWTLAEQGCCGKTPQKCRCAQERAQELQEKSYCHACGLFYGKHTTMCSRSRD